MQPNKKNIEKIINVRRLKVDTKNKQKIGVALLGVVFLEMWKRNGETLISIQ